MDAETVYLSLLGELTEPIPGVGNAFAPGAGLREAVPPNFRRKMQAMRPLAGG